MNKVVLVAAAIAGLGFGGAALADAAAGKAKFDAVCADCHEPADHAGKPAAELTKKMQGISNGTIKHKGKVKLTDAEIADLVAYFGSVKK
jgi:cytochrome c553